MTQFIRRGVLFAATAAFAGQAFAFQVPAAPPAAGPPPPAAQAPPPPPAADAAARPVNAADLPPTDGGPSDPLGAIIDAQTAVTAPPGPPAPSAAQPGAAVFPYGGGVASSEPGPSGDAVAGALVLARRGQGQAALDRGAQLSDPAERRLILWAAVDWDGEQLTFAELDRARLELAGWPRQTRREAVTERALDQAGLPPGQVISWFGGGEPVSVSGAMALADALRAQGRIDDARTLVRRWWRGRQFDAAAQRVFLGRFGSLLDADDHAARAETLLYFPQASGLEDVLAIATPDERALAAARRALREEASDAQTRVGALPAALKSSPGLAVDSARYLLGRGQTEAALDLVPHLPAAFDCPEAASRVWAVRKQLINAALKSRDYKAAYAAATNHGLTTGPDYAEAEFYAGWIALSKLHDTTSAEAHFANLAQSSTAPITQARAAYWSGRAAEARGDAHAAQADYAAGARFLTTFYGQLAAGRAGVTRIDLGRDPEPGPPDRARFEGRDLVRAAKLLRRSGERDLFRVFALDLAATLPTAEEYALLVDLARESGDQDLAMRIVRLGAQHGYVLPERGYPVRGFPAIQDAAEPAVVFGITRQESGFDPHVRSPVGARGLMQLMPRTAEILARRMGERFSTERLEDPDYNMRLGAAYIGHMISDFGGSYVMAAAAYNAGPGRPAEWISYCGDPRASGVDPLDFIECIPFSETRNYVMRVLEATEVYRARLSGGAAPLDLAGDLKRGTPAYAPPPGAVAAVPAPSLTPVAGQPQAPAFSVEGALR